MHSSSFTLKSFSMACFMMSVSSLSYASNGNQASLLEQYKNLKAKSTTASHDALLPGMGFSSDADSIAPTVCYKPLTVTRGNQHGLLNFDMAESMTQIANDLNISGEMNSTYSTFSASGLFKYMNQIKEDDYSLTLNYIQKVSDTVNLTYSYSPKSILTEIGAEIYQEGNNPYFRIFCGDRLIPSYEEGAVLIMSMKIHFQDKSQKETFNSHIGMGVGNFFNASAAIQKIASQYHLNGYINVSAFQMGGNPAHLSKILGASLPACDINNIAKCQEAAGVLISYANNDFPAQFDREGEIWKSPLVPLGAYEKGYRVSDFGLKLSPSFVTQAVIDARKKLSDIYKRNEFRHAGFTHILKNYPIPLDQQFQSALISGRDAAQKNIRLLEDGINGEGAATDCWKLPNSCIQVAANIDSHLIFIAPQLLEPINAPVFRVPGYAGSLWPDGQYESTHGNPPYRGGYKSYRAPEEQGWHVFSLGEMKGRLWGSHFSANGQYHDGGDCPYDDSILLGGESRGGGPYIGGIQIHQHSAGACHGGDHDVYYDTILQATPNPFWFDMIK